MEEINKSIKELERFINEKGYVEYGIENACGELDIVFYQKLNGETTSLCRPTELVTIHAVRALKTLRAVKLIREDKESGDKLVKHTLRNNSIQGAFDKLNEAVEQLKRARF